MLARPHAALVELPELGPLALGVPLPEGVAERQHALFGSGLVLVAPGAAEGGVEAVLVDGVEQRGRLQPVARGHRAGVGDAALVDGVLHLGHEEPGAQRVHLRVPVVEHLGEVVTGVDVEYREGDLPRLEGLRRQVQQDGGVLTAAEEQDGPLRLGGDLADDEDGQRLEQVQVAQRVAEGSGPGRSPTRRSDPAGPKRRRRG